MSAVEHPPGAPASSDPHGSAYRSAALVMSLFLTAKLLGFVEKQVLAYRFGTSVDVDAFLIVLGFLIALYDVLRNVAGPAFLPVFLRALEERGRDAALRFAGGIGMMSALAMGSVCLAVYVVAGSVAAPALAPGLDAAGQGLVAELLRLLLPAGVPLAAAAITYLVFNGFGRFFVPAFGELSFKIWGTLALVVLVLSAGAGIEVLVIGYAVGGFSMLAIHLAGLGRSRGQLVAAPRLKDPYVRQVLVAAGPLALAAGAMAIRVVLEGVAASMLGEGAVSAVRYAFKLVELPTVAVGEPLAIVFFATFAAHAARGERDEQRAALASSMRACVALSLPLAIGLAALDREIVRLLFERGAFDAASTAVTTRAVAAYAPVLPLVLLDLIVTRLAFAEGRIRATVAAEVVASGLNVVLLFALGPALDVASVPVAFAAGRALKVVAVLAIAAPRVGPLDPAGIARAVARLAAVAGAATASVLAAGPLAERLAPGDGTLARALLVAGPGAACVTAAFATAWIVGLPEARALASFALARLRRR